MVFSFVLGGGLVIVVLVGGFWIGVGLVFGFGRFLFGVGLGGGICVCCLLWVFSLLVLLV